MDLKELLGDAYREGMTAEEIQKILVDKVNETKTQVDTINADLAKHKKIVSERNSEVAKIKKDLEAKLTEDELKEQQVEEARKALVTELEELRKDSSIAKNTSEFVRLGYSDELAKATAEALYSGETEKVFANQKTFLTERENAIKAELLQGQKQPGPGLPGTKKKWTDYTMEQMNELEKTDPVKYKELLNSIE